MGTDLRHSLRDRWSITRHALLLCVLALVLALPVAITSQAQSRDPVVDVSEIGDRRELGTARGVIDVEAPKLAVEVAGPQGKPVTLELNSIGKGPKFHWSLFAFSNTGQTARRLVFTLPSPSFLSSKMHLSSGVDLSGFAKPLQVTSSLGTTFLNPISYGSDEAFGFALAPGERVTLAIETAHPTLLAYIWDQQAFETNQRSRNFFHGALLGISFLVAFASLALYGLRARKINLAGAAFAFASLGFLAQDMGTLNGLWMRLPAPVSASNSVAFFEAAMTASAAALLACFHNYKDWRTTVLNGLLLLALANLILSFVYPEYSTLVSRVGFFAVASIGFPVLLQARSDNRVAFVGVVLVWSFIVGWAFLTCFALIAKADPIATSPLLWATLTAINAVLGLVLFKQVVESAMSGQPAAPASAMPPAAEAVAMTGAGHVIWDWRPAENRLEIGQALVDALGYPRGTSIDSTQKFLELLHPDDAPGFKTLIAEIVSGSSPYLHAWLRLRDASMNYRAFVLRAQTSADAVTRRLHCIGTLTEQPDYFAPAGEVETPPNITEPPLVEESVTSQPEVVEEPAPVVLPAETVPQVIEDETGLVDRSTFFENLDHLLSAPSYPAYRVMMIGLDRFKVINEGLGHAAGDQLLHLVSKRLFAALAPGDLACRMSGSQFAVYCAEDREGDRGWELARIITVNLGRPINVEGRDIAVSATMGLSQPARSPLTAEDILAQATSALLVAKSRGLGQVAQYEPGMRDDRPVKLTLEQDLRGAIDRKEIEVQYQPITRLDSFELAGFEALARWRHPERGLIPPAEFITMAEQSGAIDEIGTFVLGEAARQLGVWQRTLARGRQMFMAVNVSSSQLLDENFVPQLERILRRDSIAPGSLKLEITESVVIKYPERMKLLFAALKQRGISIACDDFGTGFSSLSVLRELPFDTLKVDRSFISPNGIDDRARHVLETILELAHGLNMTVVAEGIENESTADAMSNLGFDYGQGYYFGMAAPAHEVEDLLAVLPRMVETDILPPMQPLEPYDMPRLLPSIYKVQTDTAEAKKEKPKKRKKRSRVPDVS